MVGNIEELNSILLLNKPTPAKIAPNDNIVIGLTIVKKRVDRYKLITPLRDSFFESFTGIDLKIV